jgi:hypothetical protein
MNVYPYLPLLLAEFCDIRYKRSALREGRTFITIVSKITFTRVP